MQMQTLSGILIRLSFPVTILGREGLSPRDQGTTHQRNVLFLFLHSIILKYSNEVHLLRYWSPLILP